MRFPRSETSIYAPPAGIEPSDFAATLRAKAFVAWISHAGFVRQYGAVFGERKIALSRIF
jgi:hypothetical protein